MQQFSHPTLLLNEAQCRLNIQTMATKAQRLGLRFRPHFKTHQSQEIGRWFRAWQVSAITVSSLSMAAYFAADGWQDITVAFPCNILEINTINTLAQQIKLGVVVESLETLDFLLAKVNAPLNIWIKIDVGYHRTGIAPENTDLLNALLDRLKVPSLLHFQGFLSHAGHSYKARSLAEIADIHQESLRIMAVLRQQYSPVFPNLQISLGDTPTCSTMDDFEGVDEIRPGNFVFYDLMQCHIGSCSPAQVAVAMACPVAAVHASRKQVVIYGGGVHLSKDNIQTEAGQTSFGRIAVWGENGDWHWLPASNYVKSLSQEHGIVQLDDQYFSDYKIGNNMLIIPVHSCLSADLMAHYQSNTGQQIPRWQRPYWHLH